MWDNINSFFNDANFHWKDVVIILCIGAIMMMVTSYIFN